jgi:hypothetical protein
MLDGVFKGDFAVIGAHSQTASHIGDSLEEAKSCQHGSLEEAETCQPRAERSSDSREAPPWVGYQSSTAALKGFQPNLSP